MIQRGYRALVLWIVWAAASMVIYLGLYQDTDVLAFIKNDPSRITWTILGLFLIGVITSFLLTLIITWESITVDKLDSLTRKHGWRGIESIPRQLTVARFFAHMKTIIDNNGELDVDSLVDVEFAVYQRIAHGLEIIGNLLITLGLIGTVVGLTLTLTGLTSSLEALGDDQEQLLSGLRSAMSGMGTAFYTTLLGSVLGGILLRVFAHIDQNGVESMEEALTRICLVHCSADFKPSTQRDLRTINAEVETLTRNMLQLQSVLNDTRDTITDFSSELKSLQDQEANDDSIKLALALRKEYHRSLREEFQLKRLNKGKWLSVLRHSVRKE